VAAVFDEVGEHAGDSRQRAAVSSPDPGAPLLQRVVA
jgi:hypothetical protein